MVYATIQALLSKNRNSDDHVEDKPSGLKLDTSTSTESAIENQKWNPGLFGMSKHSLLVQIQHILHMSDVSIFVGIMVWNVTVLMRRFKKKLDTRKATHNSHEASLSTASQIRTRLERRIKLPVNRVEGEASLDVKRDSQSLSKGRKRSVINPRFHRFPANSTMSIPVTRGRKVVIRRSLRRA